MLFDSLAIQIDDPKAWNENLSIDNFLTDTCTKFRLWLSNGALIYTTATQSAGADVVLNATTRTLPAIVFNGLKVEMLEKVGVTLSGDPAVLGRLAALLDPGDPSFPIVTPRTPSGP